MADRPRYKSAFLLSHALFAAYAGIFWIATDSGFLEHPYETLVAACACATFGLPVGFACSSFVVLWLSRKNLVSAGLILLLVVSPIVPLSILGLSAIGSRSVFPSVCLVVTSFVVCCKALSIYLPDIVFEYPRCRGCSYNLSGNQSGVCPECGLKLDSLMLEGLD